MNTYKVRFIDKTGKEHNVKQPAHSYHAAVHAVAVTRDDAEWFLVA